MSEVFLWREAPAAEFAVIGDPVGHSLSPRMHNAAFAHLGLPYRYVAVQVPASEVQPALEHLRALGYCGLNVTVPHKQEAFAWAGETDDFTARVGAANTLDLQGRIATNTDGPGFIDTLTAAGVRPNSRVLLLGAGGAARAAALALVESGYDLCIYNRTRQRAVGLISDIGIRADVLTEPRGQFDLVINATSAGLQDESPLFDWSSSRPGLAYDMLYADEPTPFLEAALKNEWMVMDGKPLLVAQGARSFTWWLGIPAPLDIMAEAVA